MVSWRTSSCSWTPQEPTPPDKVDIPEAFKGKWLENWKNEKIDARSHDSVEEAERKGLPTRLMNDEHEEMEAAWEKERKKLPGRISREEYPR